MTDFTITAGRITNYPTIHYGAKYGSTKAIYCLDNDFGNIDAGILSIPNLPFSVVTSSPVQVTNKFAGMHVYRRGMDAVKNITFGTVRSHDIQNGKGRWQFIQPSVNTWDWVDLDSWVNTHYNAGRDLIITLFGTPNWASARKLEQGIYGPGNLGISAEPTDMNDWSTFCSTIATRYLGKVKYYEVWNEPNYHNDGTGPGANNDCFFTGTYAKLSEMVRRANQAIKAVDSNTKIICPPIQGWATTSGTSDIYFTGMMGTSDGASGVMATWVDIIGVHLYPPNKNNAPDIVSMVSNIQNCLDSLGISGKEIWDTESSPIPNITTLTDSKAQLVLARDLLIKAAVGIARTNYYQLDLDPYNILYSQVLSVREDIIKTLMSGTVKNVFKFTDGRIGYWNGTNPVIL